MQSYISKYLLGIKDTIPNKKRESDDFINLETELSYLLSTKEWNKTEEELSSQLARRVDITKKFQTKYTLNWKKIKNTEEASSFLGSLATFVLYVRFKKLEADNTPLEELLKCINAIMKALDVAKEEWISEGSSLYIAIHNDFNLLLGKLPLSLNLQEKHIINLKQIKTENKTIPVTLLYSEGPIARAYLEIFKSMGLKPKKIINIVSSVDLVTKKTVGRFLPLKYRKRYAAFSQESKINYWPRKIEKKHPELQKEIFREINEKYSLPIEILNQTTKKLNLSEYCENIETLLINGLNDKSLYNKLTKVKEGVILYTGGGIVPPSLLSISETRFIHIHPGLLPDIKGADCTLWSSMIFKRASASCFYMSPGIDTGDIIMARILPEISFDINTDKYDLKILYRAVYSYLDPWIRAALLREFLSTYDEFMDIQTVQQDEKDGYTYYFMHENVKKAALKSLFSEDFTTL